MKKLPVNEVGLLLHLIRWRDEAEKQIGCATSLICVAHEAGRDGFVLVRRLQDRGIEAHVMHATIRAVR